MSTTPPVTPVPVPKAALAPSIFSNTSLLADWKWLTTHLILVLVLVAVAFGSVYYVNSIIEQHDAARQSADAKILAQATQQTATLQAALAADQKASAARDARASATISSLLSSLTARDAALKTTLAQNASLTAVQAAQKLTQQTGATSGEITAVGNTVVADLPTAIKFVNAFDQLAVAQADLVADQGIITATNTKLADATKNLSDASAVIVSQKTQLTDADKACKDQIAVVKAKARKHGFWAALGGIIGGIVLGHALGI